MAAPAEQTSQSQSAWDRPSAYEQWIAQQGLPIHRGYYVEDFRTVEVGWWKEREVGAAFVVMAGQEGVSEVRVSEVPPGHTTAPARMALDEIVYVGEGRGITTIWADGGPERSFEWQKHSLFLLPANCFYRLSNTSGERAARLLHYNALPLAMSVMPDPGFWLNNAYVNPTALVGEDFYSEARFVQGSGPSSGRASFWKGNFFPDMGRWDQFLDHRERGASAQVVWIQYPSSPLWNHMSLFSHRVYKKAHRHGPGTLIVIPSGEGYSYMWAEGKEKVLVPWHEGSLVVPPNRWYHQHFNVGLTPARYLAFHSPRANDDYQARRAEGNQQIEYVDEDPVIRKTFEEELARRGMTSLMPPQIYSDPAYAWEEPQDGA